MRDCLFPSSRVEVPQILQKWVKLLSQNLDKLFLFVLKKKICRVSGTTTYRFPLDEIIPREAKDTRFETVPRAVVIPVQTCFWSSLSH